MYKIIYADRRTITEALQVVVNEVSIAEEQGWRAQGGIAISYQNDSNYVYAAQAMVKYEDTPSNSKDEIKVLV